MFYVKGKKKLLLKLILHSKHISLFPASVLLMHIHPFLPPQSSRSHSSRSERHFVFLSMPSWKCVHVASARTKKSSSLSWCRNPRSGWFPKTSGGLKTSQTISAQKIKSSVLIFFYYCKDKHLTLGICHLRLRF